ncbi:MAG: response regulator [Clostridiales bacterium]
MDNAILFVDDQIEILDLLKKFLYMEPYKKYFTTNVKEALDYLKYKQISVVVTDLEMPKTNGLQFLNIIKNNYPDIIPIVLSGHTSMSMIIEAINNGHIYKYIPKPWKIDDSAKEFLKEAIKYYNSMKNSIIKKNFLEINDIIHVIKSIGIKFEWIQNDKVLYSNIENSMELSEKKEIFINNNNIIKLIDEKVSLVGETYEK